MRILGAEKWGLWRGLCSEGVWPRGPPEGSGRGGEGPGREGGGGAWLGWWEGGGLGEGGGGGGPEGLGVLGGQACRKEALKR